MAKFTHILPALFASTLALNATTISAIQYKGLIHLSQATASEISGINVGDQLNIDRIDDVVKKFFTYGYFSDIYVTEAAGVVTYHFKEKAVISNVDLKGYDSSKSEELLQRISIKKGNLYDSDLVEKAREDLTAHIEAEGYYDTVVEVEKEILGDNSLKLTFVVNRGEKVTIDEVVMNGAKAMDFDDVRNSVANKSRQFAGWMIGRDNGELKANDLAYDHLRIEDHYKKKGYIDAKVTPGYIKVNNENHKAKLSYNVKEGEKYTVGDIGIKMREDIADVAALKEKLILRSGLVFNIERVRKDMKKIEAAIKDKGYANARIFPDLKKNPNNKSVDIMFMVDPGKPVFIRDIYISGNSVTQDTVIRREMLLAPNDLYNFTDLKESKNALGRTGYFENVEVEEKRVAADKVDLFIKVKEAPTGSLMLGGGYGSYDGVLITGSVSDRNIFGSGIDGSMSVDLSKHTKNFNLSLQNPRLGDSLYSLGGSLYKGEYQGFDYTEDRSGGSLNVGRKINRYTHVGVTYAYTQIDLSELPTSLSEYYDRANYKKSSLIPAISYNTTDDYLLPREGMVATLSDEIAGIGFDAKFNKVSGSLKYYYGLNDIIDYDLILRYKARAGFIQDNGYVPLNDKLYMGGLGSVRGFDPRSISPKNSSGALLGGDRYVANSFEASIPLVESAKMRLAGFYDYGAIGNGGYDLKKSSVGAQIEWQSPMGAIVLVFAKPMDDEDGDRTASFEFSMGRSF